MAAPPALDRYDAAAAAGVVAVLVLAYVVVPGPTIQYAAWLTVFCIWMLWFVFYGAKWLYDVEV